MADPELASAQAPWSRANRDPETGRFIKGNKAARRHGLRALAGDEVRARSNRAGWMLRRVVTALAEEGRPPLKSWQLMRVRRWCECEIIATDAWDELERRGFPRKVEGGDKLFEIWRAAVADQGKIAAELKLTPATEATIRDPAREAHEAQQRLHARVLGGDRLVSIVAALPGQGFVAVLRGEDVDHVELLPVVAWLVADDGQTWPLMVDKAGVVQRVPDDVDRLIELRPAPLPDIPRALRQIVGALNRQP